VRIWLIGLGTVGRWLLRALDSGAEDLRERYGFEAVVVGAGRGRDGFIHDPDGLAIAPLLALLERSGSLEDHPGAAHWGTVADGLRETEADVLVEVGSSPASDGEPGATHVRAALERGIPAVCSNKWPLAHRGVELARLARERRTALRAEATVMSGTPVLSALREGLAGARPAAARGVLNATANFILSAIAAGAPYEEAVESARAQGLAERDPSADLDGHDSVAKVMILAALVFGVQLRVQEVAREGIAGLDPSTLRAAAAAGEPVRLVETIEAGQAGGLRAAVGPGPVPAGDPLAATGGATCGLVVRADPVGEVAVIGPGAGPELAGQGVLSDLIAVARTVP